MVAKNKNQNLERLGPIEFSLDLDYNFAYPTAALTLPKL